MTRRERFKAIMNHKEVDTPLLDLCGCPLSGMSAETENKLCGLLGISGEPADRREALLQYLDIDTRGVGDILTPKQSIARRLSDTANIDAWGVERRFTGLYWDIVNAPLRDLSVEDLDKYPWPDPRTIDPDQIDAYARHAKYLHEETDYVVCASHPVLGVFELGCWMCGFDEFMIRMAIDPDFVIRFFEIILDYQRTVIDLYYPKLAPYIDYTSSGDDFATQQSTFVSPDMFNEFIAPFFSERIRHTKRITDAAYLHHSCGNVSSIIPDLVRCGVEILNPIQPTGADMAPKTLKEKYGDTITFHGGLDTQAVLPGGTEETVRRAVHALLSEMMPGGGYIFAAAHNLQDDVPPENIAAMFKAAREYTAK